jgi:hypothetical protein
VQAADPLQPRYLASWAQNGLEEGCSWSQQTWQEARDVLARQIADYIYRWPRGLEEDKQVYVSALIELMLVAEPSPGEPWSRRLPFHTFTITPEGYVGTHS